MELLQANKKKRLPYQGLKLKVMLTTFCSHLIKQVTLHDHSKKEKNSNDKNSKDSMVKKWRGRERERTVRVMNSDGRLKMRWVCIMQSNETFHIISSEDVF